MNRRWEIARGVRDSGNQDFLVEAPCSRQGPLPRVSLTLQATPLSREPWWVEAQATISALPTTPAIVYF